MLFFLKKARVVCFHFPLSILLFSALICGAGEDGICQLSSPLWNLSRMWLSVNLSCPRGHLFTYLLIHPSIDLTIHPSLPSFFHPLLPPLLPLRFFPKAANNPLHLQKLRTLQPAKSRACDLASVTTESGRKTGKCRERKERVVDRGG